MKPAVLFAALVPVVMLGAAALRLADLGNRPMHCDEANQALKFGRLLEKGEYFYDPHEHHGPSLNYLTLPVAWLGSAHRLTQITETHLRLVPAAFGIVLVGLVWLVRHELGPAAAFWAALLTAVSPAMVFYSRYYIHEMLLVCFTFGAMIALWRYMREIAPLAVRQPGLRRLAADGTSAQAGTGRADVPSAAKRTSDRGSIDPTPAAREKAQPERHGRLRQALWLVLLGACLGMMHATKETWVIALFAMCVAAAATMGELRRMGLKQLVPAGLVVLVTGAGVSMLLFSSFFDNPRGVVDSVTAYVHYFGRASGEGSAGPQAHPWYYYLSILFWWHRPGGRVWTEASIAALALVGLVAAALGKGLKPAQLPMARFLSIYTVLMTAVYSAMPYKTPWCALGLLHGMILLAGVGAVVLVRVIPTYPLKAVAIALLVAAAGHLSWQAYRASFVEYEDPANPYVYVHTTGDVPLLAERVREIAAVHADGAAMHVQVICPDDDYWPLPWYLRDLSRVGWFNRMPQGPAAPVIITWPEMEPSLVEYLYRRQPPGQRHLYVPIPREGRDGDWLLRPNVPLRAYVRLSLWEAYLAAGAEEQ